MPSIKAHKTTGRLFAALYLIITATVQAEPSGARMTRPFHIEPQSLRSALDVFGEQSQLQLFYSADLIKDLKTSGVKGQLNSTDALKTLLKGSDLNYKIIDDNTITLERRNTSQLSMENILARVGEFELAEADPEEKPYSGPVEQQDMTVQGMELGYNVLNASTATKTDTPIMETPVSIQVVSKAVMDDQQVIRLDDVTKNVSGVQSMRQLGDFYDNFIIRGFQTGQTVYRDGLRMRLQPFETANLERVEILKGPVSTLYGRSQAGGLVNIVTKKPLTEAYYSLSQQFGSYDLYRTTLDATGPLTEDGGLAYRVNFAYLDQSSFRDFVEQERIFVAPQLTWKPTDAFEINLGYEYKDADITGDRGIPAVGNRPADVSIGRFIGEPGYSLNESESHTAHFQWSYKLEDNWKIQQRFAANILNIKNSNIIPLSLQADNRTINRGLFHGDAPRETYATDLNVNGKFDLAGTRHNVIVGFDYLRFRQICDSCTFLASAPFLTTLDVYNPIYGNINVPGDLPKNNFSDFVEQWFGLYFQDQIDVTDQLHFLFSGRHDWARQASGFSSTAMPESLTAVSTEKFSPRVGLVYQPLQSLSLYGHWTEALGLANGGRAADGTPFKPELAEEFEVGMKTELFEGRLNASLAYYHLTKENILTADDSTPDPSDSAAVGRARSQGIEVDVSGQISEGWSLIGSYAYTDTKVLKDNNGFEGNRLPNVPENSGSVWTVYEFFPGLKIGTGVYIAGQRQGNRQNDVQLPGYVRWDAMAAYQWKMGGSKVTAQVNVNNLLDKQYYQFLDVAGNSRFDIQPGAPLTVLGSIRLEY